MTFEPIFSPRYLFISRITGDYDTDRLFIKDQAIILTKLWDMAKIFTDDKIIIEV